MELENRTPYPAGIARMVYGADRIAASVLVRVTYDLRDGSIVPSDQQPWIVSNEPWMGPRGMMDSDLIFYKAGADVFLFGRAAAVKGMPVSEMDVDLRIGSEFRRRVRVFGPRVWYRRGGSLVPTAPRPFTSLPLTLPHAYGGKDVWDELEVVCNENPDGLGFYVDEANAVDHPLPYVEELEALIKRWDDRPTPAGLVPHSPVSPLRAKLGIKVGAQGKAKVTPLFFNAAFAPMVAEKVSPGDVVLVNGVSEYGPVRFALPRHSFFARLQFGREVHELDLAIDQVGIEVDERRVFVAYRFPFRYVVHELQERSCVLLERSFES